MKRKQLERELRPLLEARVLELLRHGLSDAEFLRLAEHYRVRLPVKSARGLLHGRGVGSCLAPMLPRSGVAAWFDPTLKPKHGDLVLIEQHDEWLEKVRASIAAESPEYRRRWHADNGDDAPRNVCKFYVERDGEPWLLWNQGGVRLSRMGRVIGVARHVEVDGVPVLGSRGRRSAWEYARAAAFVGGLVLIAYGVLA